MDSKFISEAEYRDYINKKAEAVKNNDDLIALIDEITTYEHDYGTIVIGCAAAMNGAFEIINNSPSGGITGFQASCLAWELVPKYMMVEPPCRLIDFNHMLYPQYESDFDKTISPKVWAHLQEQAKSKLNQPIESGFGFNQAVVDHWRSIVNGTVPFGYSVRSDD